jgi:pantetheine-phosphate adenylyltransferase
MSRICLFPGTFDPVTLGHIDIIDRAVALFDHLVIGIGINSAKQPMFPLEKRMQWCKAIYKDNPAITVQAYEGLTVNFCNKIRAGYILRGIRYVSDFEYEKSIAAMNRRLDSRIETIFLVSSPEFSTVASTLVRDVIRNGGDASPFLPKPVADDLNSQKNSLK